MRKRILLIGYNFYPEPTGIGKYSGEMMQWLARAGYDCTAITAYPYYPYWRVQEPYRASRFWYQTEQQNFEAGGRLTTYRCPMYVPSNPSGLKRILLDFSFTLSALGRLLALAFGKKYDCVVVVAPSFQFGLLGIISKLLWRTTFVYHIQDMQIEAARDLGIIKSEAVINFLFKLEKRIFNQADFVSSISDGMVQKIKEKAGKPVLFFPNWVDNTIFYPLADKAVLKQAYGFAPTDKLVLYSGAIGEKQGLEAIIQAAKHFEASADVKFLICGSGPYKSKLEALASSLSLSNVVFLPLQPIEKFNFFLNMADVHLVIQKANASDLVMPSKLTTILAVGGLALITVNPESGLYQLVKKYDMGLLVEAESQAALNASLQQALASDGMPHHAHNGRLYAEQYLSVDTIMRTFARTVLPA
jgi:colanic acid biosynthesis glycosyl transferase WcaI